ncbi:MAG: enoyl-CoA hydratase/isomerase family protein [Acidobacteria bacterium]|nr:enoyl-CoA hydratase/isomerase family protein [Acidobacteriota bacterium]
MGNVLSIERRGPVAVATISRPPANALNDELVGGLEAVVEQVSGDQEVSVLHFRTDQKIFCGGADLAFMQTCFSTPEGPNVMLELVRRLQRLFDRMEDSPVISIAEIGGAALGGGFELALACDLRVAAIEAKMGLPEVRLGLIPGAGGTQRLARLCGHAVAKRLILEAEVVDGAQAERLGMVQWSHPRQQLAEWTRDLAARLGNMSRAALAAAKSCIAAQGHPTRDGYAEEIAQTQRLYYNADTRRKISEFLNRSGS